MSCHAGRVLSGFYQQQQKASPSSLLLSTLAFYLSLVSIVTTVSVNSTTSRNLFFSHADGSIFIVKPVGAGRKGAKMTEHKRRPASLEPVSLSCGTRKRYKTEVPISRKEKKEIMGERVATLQQLVSPFGKTDTASVLFEAMEYIKFLHDQVKVLSAPYLPSASTREMQEPALFDLRNHGLCLVPISCTLRVARANGADIWASMKGSAL